MDLCTLPARWKIFTLVLAVAALAGGASQAQAAAPPLDGRSLAGWTTVDGKPVGPGWEVVDGVIHLKKGKSGGGNIVTAQEFGNFSLSFEWKISPGGNSGIKYRVRSYDGKTLGCEYQIFDDGGKRPPQPKNSAGSLYDLYEPSAAKQLKPVGEYNTGRIVVRGNHIEHWLNGELIVSAQVGSQEWRRRIAASKFHDIPHFAEYPRGKLMLTDHGSEVWYRNLQFQTYADTSTTARTPVGPLRRFWRSRFGR